MCSHAFLLTLIHLAISCRKCAQAAIMGETAKQLLPHEILLLNEQLLALNLDVASTDLCNVAYRVTQDNTLYYSSHYRRVKARNSYTVKFKDVDGSVQYGQIQFFVCMSGHIFAFIMKLEIKPESCQAHFGISHNSLDALHVSRIVPVESAVGSIVCIPVSDLFLNVFLYQLMICANVSM